LGTEIWIGLALAALAMVGAYLWYSRPEARRARRIRALEERYLRRSSLPHALALEALDRHLSSLQRRHPDRSHVWYLERVLSDLERDRR
jgi:hypothetical protein